MRLRAALAPVLALSLAVLAGARPAGADGEALARVLQIDAVLAVVRDEGIALGQQMDEDFLDGSGGGFWQDRVGTIYSPDRLRVIVVEALDRQVDDADEAAIAGFFDSERGRRILTLELGARRAMIDPDVEEIARQTFLDLEGTGDPLLQRVSVFAEVNDLVERNVAGRLSADYHFTRGMADGGGLALSQGEIIDEVWSREDEVRADSESWLMGFLLMAYGPLPQSDLDAYIAFSQTPAGQVLNAALFDGFDEMYRQISYLLGQSVAQAMAASDL